MLGNLYSDAHIHVDIYIQIIRCVFCVHMCAFVCARVRVAACMHVCGKQFACA